ncbi:PLP-dependent aminotransferase family protein [Leeia sp. TBRC 13508]|uniref:Putative 8-amino-7-oxononanoate synthase n=1 Tax=Leeia speluncae TaxID=2884804 RepID=A0ABS8D1F2_9NEIS|nr:PLP-dependent aminotransferase family protein [Leeia speluncae]MCB6182014.1 PLP-dependent aminotransferase family protein [Leeia speluncae]
MWLPDLSTYSGPRYLALVSAIEFDIRNGKLQPGERLPPQRLLADLLGVHLSTVTRAYKTAISQHLVYAAMGNGTFVSHPNAAPKLFSLAKHESTWIDLSVSTYPIHADDQDLSETLQHLCQTRSLAHTMAYRQWDDWQPIKDALANWFEHQHQTGKVNTSDLTLCTGAQHALTEVLASFVSKGESILCESLTYPGLKTVATQLGIRLIGIPMSKTGIDLIQLEKKLKQGGIRTLVLMPTLHNPTTMTMPIAEREALAALIRRYPITVIEEDVYGPFAKHPQPAMVSICPEKVIYISGLSKTVAPGLRIGAIFDPGKQLPFGEGHWHSTSWYVNPLQADIAEEWLKTGTALKRLQKQKKEMHLRHQIADSFIGQSETDEHFSPHRWLHTQTEQQSHILANLLLSHGIRVASDRVFSTTATPSPSGIRMALASAPDHARLREAMQIIAEVRTRL